jgi:parallel beta-helix repeat protein
LQDVKVGRERFSMRSNLILLLLSTLVGPALATDDVLEINQACAENTGCFAGDTAGFPVTIGGKAGRSYRLTGDLIVPDENTDGIVVSTNDVGIDLNNFAITSSRCQAATTDCTPVSGSGSGVEITSSSSRGISVKNGSITGMGSFGVFLGDQAEVSGLRVRWNRITGIAAGANSTVSGNTVDNNGGDGIFANSGSTVAGNTAKNNRGNGIFVTAGSTVQHNIMRLNGGYGLNLIGDAAYGGNIITGNTTGTILGTGVNLGDNECAGTGAISAFCP